MGLGHLKIETRSADEAIPIANADVLVKDNNGKVLYHIVTDDTGTTEVVSLYAPGKEASLYYDNTEPHYSTCRVEISKDNGFITKIVNGVKIFDSITTILPVAMLPISGDTSGYIDVVNVPPNAIDTQTEWHQEGPTDGANLLSQEISPFITREIIIPDYIVVHLGRPTETARNVRVKFTEYIKNVASHEIYPTWPQNALEANIYAIITFALNRVFTEWYPNRGFNFDITNSTAADQYFVEGGEIYSNIAVIVDRIFNSFVRREGRLEPFFTQFCNGTTATCPGLSQWGTVTLANQGMSPIQILRYYYPRDIQIVTSNNITGITESYPGIPLREGMTNNDVQIMQRYLNRIRVNYPRITSIANPNGSFLEDTTKAVKLFQGVFDLYQDGIIGRATWNKISYIFVAVARIAELESEGIRIGIGTTPPTSVLREGSSGSDVVELQFILNFIAQFYPTVTPTIQDGTFGAATATSVKQFQQTFDLTQDGIVGPGTWNMLYQVYKGIEDSVNPPVAPSPVYPPFPGYLLSIGSRGSHVLLMQQYLNIIASQYPSIPTITADGIFGNETENAVRAFQNQFDLKSDGIIGQITWSRIVNEHDNIVGQTTLPEFPGVVLRLGSRGDSVSLIQRNLNDISNTHTSIPKVTVDGIFGPNTQSAVIAFQNLFGLLPDGIVGQLTWDAIVNEWARVMR